MINKGKLGIRNIAAFLAAALVFQLSAVPAYAKGVREHDVRELSPISDICYEESLDEVNNPYIGFYRPIYLTLKREGNSASSRNNNLVHIRGELSDFSKSYNGISDQELTQDALNAFEDTLKNLRKNHQTAIVRFAYHPNYEGDKTYEPSIEMILKHQEQLGNIISDYSDVVVTVECGMLGLWGEMHTSSMCTKENFNKVIDKWLEVLPSNITVNVRTPEHFCDWSGADRSNLSSYITKQGDKSYRVGIYNDGYLGSDSDLGTFSNRAEEIKWISSQATHTLYGGEVVANDGTGNVKNTASFMESEAFKTHTSYLNIEWNDTVINNMKKEAYSGKDTLYSGSTGFEFIRNRLGYRYVVKNVKLTRETTAFEDFKFETDIENKGFANLIRDKKQLLIIEGNNKIYKYNIMTENAKNSIKYTAVTNWKSQDTVSIVSKIDLPNDMPVGQYNVYLRLADDETSEGLNGYPIRFANKALSSGSNIWNEELGANLLGSFQVLDESTIEKYDGTEDTPGGSSGSSSGSGSTDGSDNIPTGGSGNGSANGSGNNSGEKTDGNKSNIPSSKKVPILNKQYEVAASKSTFKVKVVKINHSKKTGNISIIKVKKAAKNVVIPATISLYGYKFKVTEIGKKAFMNCKAQSLIIGKNVTKIGVKAFYGMKKCKKLTIQGTSLTSKKVGKDAFSKMNVKMKVKLPSKKKKSYMKWLNKKGLILSL